MNDFNPNAGLDLVAPDFKYNPPKPNRLMDISKSNRILVFPSYWEGGASFNSTSHLLSIKLLRDSESWVYWSFTIPKESRLVNISLLWSCDGDSGKTIVVNGQISGFEKKFLRSEVSAESLSQNLTTDAMNSITETPFLANNRGYIGDFSHDQFFNIWFKREGPTISDDATEMYIYGIMLDLQ